MDLKDFVSQPSHQLIIPVANSMIKRKPQDKKNADSSRRHLNSEREILSGNSSPNNMFYNPTLQHLAQLEIQHYQQLKKELILEKSQKSIPASLVSPKTKRNQKSSRIQYDKNQIVVEASKVAIKHPKAKGAHKACLKHGGQDVSG